MNERFGDGRAGDRLEGRLSLPTVAAAIIVLIVASVVLVLNWYDLQTAQLWASALIPVTAVALGYLFSRHQERRQERIDRRLYDHIEFTLEANVHGPKKGFYLVEFVMYAHNKGLGRTTFPWMKLRVLGHAAEATPTTRKRSEHRMKFGSKVIEETNIFTVGRDGESEKEDEGEGSKKDDEGEEPEKDDEGEAKKVYKWFVESDVKQSFTYVALIDAKYEYILAKAWFPYDSPRLGDHTVERMFELNPQD